MYVCIAGCKLMHVCMNIGACVYGRVQVGACVQLLVHVHMARCKLVHALLGGECLCCVYISVFLHCDSHGSRFCPGCSVLIHVDYHLVEFRWIQGRGI